MDNLQRLKSNLHFLPELYLVFATLYYWSLTANLLNPIAIFLLVILSYQLIAQNSVSGIVISSIFILLNLYLILALLSELSEFPQADAAFCKMLLIGGGFIGLNLLSGAFMMKKYIERVK